LLGWDLDNVGIAPTSTGAAKSSIVHGVRAKRLVWKSGGKRREARQKAGQGDKLLQLRSVRTQVQTWVSECVLRGALVLGLANSGLGVYELR